MAYIKKIWKDYPDTTAPIKAEDLNNIEDGLETVTNNVNNGWYSGQSGAVYSFVSWDASVRTGVVASSLDVTGLLSVGMKVKFTQSETVKFGIITAITSTQITLFMGTDYILTNAPISDAFYSIVKAPYGFPLNPNKWSISVTNSSDIEKINPTINVWYDSGISIDIPIGLWRIYYKAAIAPFSSSSGNIVQRVSIGTATSGDVISDFTDRVFSEPSKGAGITITVENLKEISTKTKYYLLYGTTNVSVTPILRILGGSVTPTILKAVCAYL